MDTYLGLSTFMKALIIVISMIIYIIIFNIAYKKLTRDIVSTNILETASDYYILLKGIAFSLLILITLNTMLLSSGRSTLFKLASIAIFLFGIVYTRSSLKLINHVITLKFMPEILAEDKSKISIIGSVDEEKEGWVFEHIIANTRIVVIEKDQGSII